MYTVTDADTVAVQKTGLVLASTLLFLFWAREDFKSLASGSWWSVIIIATHSSSNATKAILVAARLLAQSRVCYPRISTASWS